MKKSKVIGICSLLIILLASCVSIEEKVSPNKPSSARSALFSFFTPHPNTKVTDSREQLVDSLIPEKFAPFANITSIPTDKIAELIKYEGIDAAKYYANGSELASFMNGTIIEIDDEGKTAWGRYIIIEGEHNYFMTSSSKKVIFRVIIFNLATISPMLKLMDTVKANMILGTVKLEPNTPENTNFFLYTPDTADVFLNFSAPTKPVNYLKNRWFHVSTILNNNTKLLLGYKEGKPYDAAYEFCHWHDETGAERRDPPPQGFSDFMLIDGGLRFYLLPAERPYIMSSDEQQRVEEKIGYIRNWRGFGNITSVTTWLDKTYTYYLFWGPTMNKFIQEEFDPKTPVLISAMIVTADVVTNSLVLFVGDFSYKPISERLAYVASTVIDIDKE